MSSKWFFEISFFRTFRIIYHKLPGFQKRNLWKVLAISFFTSIVDLGGLAAFIPVMSAIADPTVLTGDSILARIKTGLGIVDNKPFIVILFLIVFLILVFRFLFIIFSQRMQARFVAKLSEYIGQKIYTYYLSSNLQEFVRVDSAKIIRELTVNSRNIANYLVMSLLMICSEVTLILMVVIGIAMFNIHVFLMLTLTIFPIVYLLLRVVKKKLRGFGVLQNESMSNLIASSSRGIMGFVDVKLRNKELILIDDFLKSFRVFNNISVKLSVLAVVPAKLFELTTILGLFLIIVYAYFMSNQPESVLPLITLYAAAAYRVIPSLSRLTPALMNIEQYHHLLDLYSKVSNIEASTINDNSTVGSSISFERNLSLKDIAFKFRDNDTPLFSGINLVIERGEIIGVIGKSGSGKTTLVNLIAGFYLPTTGKILIDGHQLTTENLSEWRRQISYVQQSSYLEKNSMTKNIAFLEKEVDYTRLMDSIAGASITDLLNGVSPDDFFIDEGGKNLSGGQKQRIVIARALYNRSSLIVLDEATSALDNETEDAINSTIGNLRERGITIIIVAHRYSTLKHTDRIYKMDSGKIISEMRYSDIIS